MTVDLTGGLDPSLGLVWASQPDNPDQRESVNAWMWDDGLDLGLPRIGIEAVADQWDTHDLQINIAFADGRVFNLLSPGAVHDPAGGDGQPRILGAGPLSIEMVEPFGRWVLRIDGQAHATHVDAQIGGQFPGEGELVSVRAEIDLQGAVPPWMNGALLPEARWVLEHQEEGPLMGHPWRFEQLCRSSGTVEIGAERFTIQGSANRIRRQGIRQTTILWGHAWQAAVFASGKGFGYITYPERKDGKATYNEGYVFLGDGELVPARAVDPPWLSSLAAHGQDVSFGLETPDGTTHEIRGTTEISTFMVMPKELAGGLQLQQAICRYTWDGEQSAGMLERSIAPESLV
jgi:prepilin-type processing-associated H-X9-DG protein